MTRIKQIISSLLIIAILGGLLMYKNNKDNRIEAFILDGKKALESEDYISSLTNFNQAVQLDNENPEALKGRLFSLIGLKNYQASKNACTALGKVKSGKYKHACQIAKQGDFPWYIYKPINKGFVGKYRWMEDYKAILANPNARVKGDVEYKDGVRSGIFFSYQDFNSYFLYDLDKNGIPELFLMSDHPYGIPGEKTVFMRTFCAERPDSQMIKNIAYLDLPNGMLIGRGNVGDSFDTYTSFKLIEGRGARPHLVKNSVSADELEKATPIEEFEAYPIYDTTPIDEYYHFKEKR